MIRESKMKQLKVLIVDDSAFNRQTLRRILNKVPNIAIQIAVDGHDGMKEVLKFKPDVVTLDLEMPGMDGFSLLRWIMKERPLPVIVVSSHGDDPTVFKALELGAVDFVTKPTKNAIKELEEIESDLLRKIIVATSLSMEKLKKTISLLKLNELKSETSLLKEKTVEMVAIGASTGGPTAIQSILTRLPGNFPSAIIISQHMPRGFTKQFADRISDLCSLHVKEAEHGELIEKGKALVCPGGHHMVFERLKGNVYTIIKKSSSSDRYIPSIDMMMKSAANIYDNKIIGVLLTGMGSDGKKGMLDIRKKGGFTIAESEESAIVFGMPREIILANGVDKILSLENMPAELLKMMKKNNKG